MIKFRIVLENQKRLIFREKVHGETLEVYGKTGVLKTNFCIILLIMKKMLHYGQLKALNLRLPKVKNILLLNIGAKVVLNSLKPIS